MASYDVLVRGGTIVTETGTTPADVGISAGRVVALGPELSGSATSQIDASGLHVFPGVIDAHVHLNEPGRSEWEGFATGTRALAAGGTTTFFDMPLNASPPTLDAASFALKQQAATAHSLVDFALWGGLVPQNLEQLDELAACGVIGYKAFMCNSGIDDFSAVDDQTLHAGMSRAARLHKLVAVHAEDETMTSALTREALAQGRTGISDYLASRPIQAELNAIRRAIAMAQDTGCALHIVHVSSGSGVALVAEARANGCDITCETCPHYLVLTAEDVERLGAVAKCSPPMRSLAEQERLWEHLFAGNIQFIGSDHSPAPLAMKTSANFFQVWGGISGCPSLLALLLSEGHVARDLSLSWLTELTAAAVARRFHLPQKGSLNVGADADITLVNLQTQTTLHADDLYYRHRHSPYIDKTLRGQVVQTLVRGVTVYKQGSFPLVRHGQLLTPEIVR